MFTGIIESLGEVKKITSRGKNFEFEIKSDITSGLKIDQSIAHNGVCLTVTDVASGFYTVMVIEETLQKSNLGSLQVGSKINLERSMQANGRIDGHIVQGHVDQTGTCNDIQEQEGSWLFTFAFEPHANNLIVEKGSICINGISLTCFDVHENSFKVAVIPYTYQHTNFSELRPGDTVNLEFDIIGKYISKALANRGIL